MKLFRKNLIGRLFDNNIFVKCLSLAIAVIAWFIVAITVSPDTITTIHDVPIRVAIENSGAQRLGYDVISGEDQTVDVVVRGKRYKVGMLSADNINAIVLPTSVSEPGEYDLDVIVNKVGDDADYEIVSYSPSTIKVRFDEVVSRDFKAEAVADNVVIEDGYVKGALTCMPETVTLSGPKSDLDRIAKVRVRTDISDTLSQTLSTPGTLEYYDADGQKLDLPYVKSNMTSTDVIIPVLKMKTLPLKFEFINVPQGFDVNQLKYTMSAQEIDVAASSETLENVSEINIGYIDFRQLTLNASFDFEINLPSGYMNRDNLTTVNVTFDMSAFDSKKLTVNKLTIVNSPANMTTSMLTQTINSVEIIGLKDELATVSSEDVIGEVNLIDFMITENSQRYTVPITISLPNKLNCWAVGEYTAVISARPTS